LWAAVSRLRRRRESIERAGTYTVDVALGSRTESLSNVKVERGDCDHVVTWTVTISLP